VIEGIEEATALIPHGEKLRELAGAASGVAPAIAAAPSQLENINLSRTRSGAFFPEGAENQLTDRSGVKSRKGEFLGRR
jgi:hypothetical protein